MHASLDDVAQYIRASKDVMDIAKTLIGMLPKGTQHEGAERRLAEAERALRATEVQLAQSLGYHLCQCTFPPQIMLSKGRHPRHDVEMFQCPSCEKQDPSERHFQQIDKDNAAIEARRADWRL